MESNLKLLKEELKSYQINLNKKINKLESNVEILCFKKLKIIVNGMNPSNLPDSIRYNSYLKKIKKIQESIPDVEIYSDAIDDQNNVKRALTIIDELAYKRGEIYFLDNDIKGMLEIESSREKVNMLINYEPSYKIDTKKLV